jgi:hypothetical protein
MTKQSDADALTDLARRTLPIVHALHAEVHDGLASPATRLSHDSNIASTIPTLPARFHTDTLRPILYALPDHTGVLIGHQCGGGERARLAGRQGLSHRRIMVCPRLESFY